MNASTFFLPLVSLTFLFAPAFAEEKKADPIPVTDAAKIETQLGKTATIRGKVTRVGQSKGGLHFLNFANYHFVVVCFPDTVAKFKNGTPSDLYRDQLIEVTGTIDKYKNKFQIKLAGPDQIRIVQPTAAEKAEAEATAEPDNEKKKEQDKPSKADSGSSKSAPKSSKPKKPVDPKKFFDG